MWIRIFITSCLLSITSVSYGQVLINYTINTSENRHTISPYIYGVNDSSYKRAKAVRLGGNRMTGYNWENNASHAGEDWFNHNDDYLPWIMGIPDSLRDSTAIVLSTFQNDANNNSQYSLQTLPLAGFVSADKNGLVSKPQTAPSVRWNQVIDEKNKDFLLSPDLNDGKIYIDEEINFLLNHFGDASTKTGVNGYSLDNEPSLWPSTHPRIHPKKIHVQELLFASLSLAKTIKKADYKADVFGPALYGFNGFLNLQDAPDWFQYTSDFDWFISVYLWYMWRSSRFENIRLLDVLDIHWYPEPAGIYDGDTSRTVAEERMQCVRSLWDSSYVENSWIGQWFSPVALIPHLFKSIDKHYPGTKLAITEYDYAGNSHISGAIAQVDALGIFGQQGLYFAAKWNVVDQFLKSAFDLYLNYDGNESQYGDISVFASSSDIERSSIYAAYEQNDSNRLHVILTNKSYDDDIIAHIDIQSYGKFYTSEIYQITKNDTNILRLKDMSISSNKLEMTLPKLSVLHLVLKDINTPNESIMLDSKVQLFPNPAVHTLNVSSDEIMIEKVELYDAEGHFILLKNVNCNSTVLDLSNFEDGTYLLNIITNIETISKRFIISQ